MLLSYFKVVNIASLRKYIKSGFRITSFLMANNGEPVVKKLDGGSIIGTHNGTFHCDEVLACCMLQLLPQYKQAKIVRTRDEQVLKTCDVVVDVGGKYEPVSHRYDHHQRDFTETMSSLGSSIKSDIKLSSAGLVYFHFGKEIIANILDTQANNVVIDEIYRKVYDNFVQEIDAIDNGINQFTGEARYTISTNISSRVSNLNPKWNEEKPDHESGFRKAMEMVEAEFLENISYFKNAWLPARSIVENAILNRFKIDSSGEILCLTAGGCPWKDHLFNLETDLAVEVPIKFVLFSDSNGACRIQCVPKQPKSFENRLSLLEAWRGIRNEELSKISGIPGCIFVHASGFIGGNETYEGALEMARKTLDYAAK